MNANTLLADPTAIRLEHIVARQSSLVIVVTAARRQSECPRCLQVSARVHSRYTRTVADLPWQGVSVRLELNTRRFRCTNDLCGRSIFCERIPSVVAYYARQTARLTSALELIGFAIGGEAGARLARQLAMKLSPDTLRRIRQAIPEQHPTPRVLGVDDWAFRRGHRYGTILVDLERRCPVDLLPDRTSDSLATWLRAHPGVEVISRDRACAYADGAAQGAPAAIQVADRWHLMKNMGEAVQRLLERKHTALRQAAKVAAAAPLIIAGTDTNITPAAALPLTLPEKAKRQSRERRLARYDEVVTLWQQGVSLRTIARELHLARHTVKKFVRAGSFPEQAARAPRRSTVDPYGEYLAARWAEGCHNATTLWGEIQGQGFRGTYGAVCRYLARWWRNDLPLRLQRRKRHRPVTTIKTPSARRTMWLLLGDEAKQLPDEQCFVTQLLGDCTEVASAKEIARQFLAIIRERQADALDDWMASAATCGLPEMRGFVGGLRRDLPAVRAALAYEWSNGQVEGQVNRLKLIKRQMYGRAKLDLLRQRVLHAV